MRVSKRLVVTLLLISLTVLALGGIISRKYVRLYFLRLSSRSRAPARQITPESLNNLDASVLLAEANRLSWLFNWPKAEPLYVRAEELFKQKGDTRNEIYARVGRIRAQSETMSYLDV